MWAVPKTVNAAARADREDRQREAAELLVKRAADLGLHVASGVPLTLSCGRSSSARPSTDGAAAALVETWQAIDAARGGSN